MTSVEDLYVSSEDTVRAVMKRIDRGCRGIALVVDREGKFLTTITDGDIRRAILAGATLDAPATVALCKPNGAQRQSITAPAETPREDQLKLMRQHQVRYLPLLDAEGRVIELVTPDPRREPERLPIQAVIMAGGFGKRLLPLTEHTPKPMLSVAGRPLMERTIQSFREAGINHINITTHFMPEKITDYFGSGINHGVKLNYVAETRPLGTAGALSLVDDKDESLLVVNGDILTTVDYRALVAFHNERVADLTIGVRHYEVEVPYGLIDATNGIVQRIREKPTVEFLVSAGVYVLHPRARRLIPSDARYDMTDLIDKLLSCGCVVACFPIVEYWLDIGKHDDFKKAQEDARQMPRAA